MDIKQLNKAVDKFVEDRNWEQYHNPKNLVMALSVKVGELNEKKIRRLVSLNRLSIYPAK